MLPIRLSPDWISLRPCSTPAQLPASAASKSPDTKCQASRVTSRVSGW